MTLIPQQYTAAAFVIGGIALLGLAVFGLEHLASQDEQQRLTALSITANDAKTIGADNPTVTLLEYSDFQCPACASYAPLVHAVAEKFPETLKVAYRYFPLTAIHPNAMISAQAAEAARLQGKFWEMHDQLFTHQTDWASSENPLDIFQAYAQTLELDTDRFLSDIQSDAVIDAVKNDEALGMQANIPGTPSFFLNGKKLDNPQSLEEFEKVITDAIVKNTP